MFRLEALESLEVALIYRIIFLGCELEARGAVGLRPRHMVLKSKVNLGGILDSI